MTMPSGVLFSLGSLVRAQWVCGWQGLQARYMLQVLRADGRAILGFRSFLKVRCLDYMDGPEERVTEIRTGDVVSS